MKEKGYVYFLHHYSGLLLRSSIFHYFPLRTSNIDDFSQDVRMLGALQDDDASRNKLLGAAKRLCGAFSDLLNAAEPGQKEVSGKRLGMFSCKKRKYISAGQARNIKLISIFDVECFALV